MTMNIIINNVFIHSLSPKQDYDWSEKHIVKEVSKDSDTSGAAITPTGKWSSVFNINMQRTEAYVRP